MANYKLGPVIGKIGGADVQKIPVEAVADGDLGSVHGHVVNIPEGETWLIATEGYLTPNNRFGNTPSLVIGDYFESPEYPVSPTPSASIAGEVQGPASVTVGIKRASSIGQDTFSGHVYAVPLPD